MDTVSPAPVQPGQPLLGVGGAELARALVPSPRQLAIGEDARCAQALQLDRVVGRCQPKGRRRQAGLFETTARELDDEGGSPARAAEAVRSLMFVARFLQDVERRRDALFPL